MPNKPKHEHSDRDRIFTPVDLARKLIDKIPFNYGDSWCDPCYGSGAFFDNFPELDKAKDIKHDFYEIDLGKDFLQTDEQYDWCVTNIPFSQPKEFIFQMARCSRKGFGILCLANSMTATRLKKLQSMGFYMRSMTVIYVKEWGFGYRTDFYVFEKFAKDNLSVILV